ncbi:MAG: aminomethyltransferase, partial [Ilumatobacter sp.]
MRQSPLAAQHVTLEANLVDFGGWEMPIAYPAGTIAEHTTCRESATMFDVSHLGSMRVDGTDAFERLQRTLTNDLGKIGPGRAQYTHLLDAHDASVLDDIIVWWHPRAEGEPDVFDVMPNASNTDRVVAAIGGVDTTSTRAVIAIQGPQARALVEPIFPQAAAVGRFKVGHCTWNGIDCV